MKVSDPFAVWLLDALAPLGGVTARSMFGGLGLFRDGLMFGLVAGGELYLKVDDGSRPEYEAAGRAPFGYLRRGRPATIASYCSAGDDALDDPEVLCVRARRACQAAQAVRSGRRVRGRRRRG